MFSRLKRLRSLRFASGWSTALESRFGGLLLYFGAFMAVSALTRLALLVKAGGSVSWDASLVVSWILGVVFDLAAAGWWSLPLLMLLTVLPRSFFAYRLGRIAASISAVVVVGLLLFTAVSEWTFWDEFGVRFNFIAVDYLVYTTEVIANIRESYPMGWIFTGIGIGALLGLWSVWRLGWMERWLSHADMGWPRRYAWGGAMLAIIIAGGLLPSQDGLPPFANNYNRELAKNGPWSLFAAFRNNELNFDQFYVTLSDQEAAARVMARLAEPGAERIPSPNPLDPLRLIRREGPELRPNVIQITVESLSARFLTRYGNDEHITPHLDALADQSLVFDRFYATGTRTVRGMEALTLSLPPTPGRSLVKRPNNEGLFSLGSVFQSKGYDTAFIYGGYGYFDNMNYFFGNNGYRVVDRTLVPDEEITFANAWGACDEDLLDWSLREADAASAVQKPFFHFVMTTSNHRPYTFPDGRIDLPSKEAGRAGGVKYTDYAMHRFLEQASTRPWFKDTIFVILADHCASSAGKTALPVANYHVPLLIFAPGGQVAPGVVSRLTSQVDFAPTLLGLLNWSYPSRFFGRDVMLPDEPVNDRAFIGTYQKVGLLEKDRLAVLSPVRRTDLYRVGEEGEEKLDAATDRELMRDTTAFYQTASRLYQQGAFKAYAP